MNFYSHTAEHSINRIADEAMGRMLDILHQGGQPDLTDACAFAAVTLCPNASERDKVELATIAFEHVKAAIETFWGRPTMGRA